MANDMFLKTYNSQQRVGVCERLGLSERGHMILRDVPLNSPTKYLRDANVAKYEQLDHMHFISINY